MRRAEVMAEKWRATQAHAQSIQAEREKKTTDASGSSSAPSTRGSHPLPSISPGPNSEHIRGAVSTPVTSSQVAVPAPSRSPVARTGEASEIVLPFHPLPSSNKAKAAPALVSFVPAQTEAGRTVNTNLPLSSTTLASELQRRNVEASQHFRFDQATRDHAQEQMEPEMPRQAAPTLAPHRIEVKREPSVEALPAARLQPLPDSVNADQSHNHQRVVSFSTASHDGNMDERAPISSNFESHATSLHVAQTKDDTRRSDPSGAASPRDNRPRDFVHDPVVPSTDVRAYRRQDSISSDRSPPHRSYRDRRSSSPPSPRGRQSRSPSRSPPYIRKRARSRTPLHHGERQVDRWPRPRLEDSRGRHRRHNGYERARRGGSPQHHRPPPPRRPVYRPSPPSSPRHFRNDRSPLRWYRDRSPDAQHVTQRFANRDTWEWRPDEYRSNTNSRRYEPTYEGADARRTTEPEEQPRWQQQDRQRHSPDPSEHDQTPTPSPRQEEVERDLLDRINMEEADDYGRGRGRGRPPPGMTRGGPTPRRGTRGAFGGGRGRGGVPGSPPLLLSRMHHPLTPSLTDRIQQD